MKPSFVSLLAFALVLGGCGGASVVERRDGSRVSLGAETDPEALTLFAEALRFERNGDLERASDSAERAFVRDRASGHVYALRGRLCLGPEPARAFAIWREGLEKAREKAPVYFEMARAHRSRGERSASVDAARLAVLFAPSRRDYVEFYANVLDEAGRSDDAERVRRVTELLSNETRRGPRLAPEAHLFDAESDEGQARLETLLVRGDVRAARSLTKGALSDVVLAFELLRFGHLDAARSLADAVLAAEPEDSCASLVVVIASDRALEEPPIAVPMSALRCVEKRELLLEVLARRSANAARLFRDHALRR